MNFDNPGEWGIWFILFMILGLVGSIFVHRIIFWLREKRKDMYEKKNVEPKNFDK